MSSQFKGPLRKNFAMQIQLASDLHLEHLAREFPSEALIRPARQADVLVLAGDIGHAAGAIAFEHACVVDVPAA